MKKTEITKEIEEQIKDLYVNENLSMASIAKQLDISPSTVKRRLVKFGINIVTYRQAGIFNIEEVMSLYKGGTPIHKIADMFNSSQETISKRLKENGVIINHAGVARFNECVFDEIDTEEKAYWLGFIYADGCIVSLNPAKKKNHAFTIGLQVRDTKHLEKFNIFMEHKSYNIRINKKNRDGRIFEYCRWDISNQHLWYTLNNYGCTPKKSSILQFPNENIFKSKDLIRHFIRGYFDGDGCLSYYATDYKYPASGFVGNHDFLNGLLLHLPEEFSTINLHTLKRCPSMAVISYAHKKAFRLISYLYKNSNIYLDRKYELYNYFCRSLQEYNELLQTNIGEPCDGNTEISIENKNSIPS